MSANLGKLPADSGFAKRSAFQWFRRYDHKADLSAELLEPASSPFDSLKTWHHCNILRNTNGRKTLISGATKTGMFTNCTKQIVDLNIGAYEQIFC
jgi:hypothetical protein